MKPKNLMYLELYKKDKITFNKVLKEIDYKSLTKEEIAKLFSYLNVEREKKAIGRSLTGLYNFLITKADEIIVTQAFVSVVNNPAFIFHAVKKVKNQKAIGLLADAINETGDTEWIYEFERYVKEGPRCCELTDPSEEKKILKEDAESIFYFAFHEKGNQIEELADAIIETEDAQWICEFAKWIIGAPIEKLARALFKLKKPKYFLLNETFDGKFIESIEKEIMWLEKNGYRSISEKLKEDYGFEWIYERPKRKDALEQIKLKGLVTFCKEQQFWPKSSILKLLANNLPEAELLLQVYMEFLTTDMTLEEARVLDLEYKKLVLEQVKEETLENKTSQEKSIVQQRKPIEENDKK